jgi:hypothetical protein
VLAAGKQDTVRYVVHPQQPYESNPITTITESANGSTMNTTPEIST